MPKTKESEELEKKREALDKKLKNCTFSKKEEYDKLTQGLDPHEILFHACYFVQDWGKLMEKKIKDGQELLNIYQECFDAANIENLPNLQINFAWFVLINGWVHGAKLEEIYFKKQENKQVVSN